MTHFAVKALLAGLIGLSALSALPASAAADDFGFYFNSDGGRFNRHFRHHDRFEEWRGAYSVQRPRYEGRGQCSAPRALKIARQSGLQDAVITRANKRVLTVEGYYHRRPARIDFINARGCPQY